MSVWENNECSSTRKQHNVRMSQSCAYCCSDSSIDLCRSTVRTTQVQDDDHDFAQQLWSTNLATVIAAENAERKRREKKEKKEDLNELLYDKDEKPAVATSLHDQIKHQLQENLQQPERERWVAVESKEAMLAEICFQLRRQMHVRSTYPHLYAFVSRRRQEPENKDQDSKSAVDESAWITDEVSWVKTTLCDNPDYGFKQVTWSIENARSAVVRVTFVFYFRL